MNTTYTLVAEVSYTTPNGQGDQTKVYQARHTDTLEPFLFVRVRTENIVITSDQITSGTVQELVDLVAHAVANKGLVTTQTGSVTRIAYEPRMYVHLEGKEQAQKDLTNA
jgi:uncharacterized protein YaiI (UPF0178 family)